MNKVNISRKFQDDEVVEIRSLYYDENLTPRQIAKRFKCSHTLIQNMINGKNYKEFYY